MQWIRHAAAVTARVQILRGRRERELEPAESPARHGERRLVDAPRRAIRRHDDVRREELLVLLHEGVEMTAADLFLTLEHELHVDGQHRWLARRAQPLAVHARIAGGWKGARDRC